MSRVAFLFWPRSGELKTAAFHNEPEQSAARDALVVGPETTSEVSGSSGAGMLVSPHLRPHEATWRAS